MATCRHCGAKFGSQQGVRAHLRHCAAWKDRATRQGSLGREPRQGRPADPVRAVEHEVRLQEARLKLRKVRGVQEALEGEEADRGRRAAEAKAARDREAAEARRQAKDEEFWGTLRLLQEQRQASGRRRAIQEAKEAAITRTDRWDLPPEAIGDALAAVERALAELPLIHELPQDEVNQIARAAAAKVLKPYREARQRQ